MAYKLKVRLPDGRMKLCGTSTTDQGRYNDIRTWVQSLKKGRHRRLDVLEAIVCKNVPLADAFDLRHDPDSILALTGVRNIEPLVEKWYDTKRASRKGAMSADDYRRQVRGLIVAKRPFPLSRFTAAEIRRYLRALDVEDPTRNRHKAAFSSFAQWLVDEDVVERNVVSDVKGWSNGAGRELFYEMEQAQAVLDRIVDPEHKAMYALAVGAGIERGVMAGWREGRNADGALHVLRVRDLLFDKSPSQVYADGGKNKWRRRYCRIVKEFAWCEPAIKAWIANRTPDSPVFDRAHNEHGVLNSIAEAAAAAQVPRLTLHDQRHTHAVNLLKLGYAPQVPASNLGHRDVMLVYTRYGRYVVDDRDFTRPAERGETVRMEIVK